MAFYSVLFVIIVPMVAGSIVVACLPLRSTRVRVPVLLAHVLVSVALIALLDGPFALWLIVFGIGLLIAVGRLVADGVRAVRWPGGAGDRVGG